MGTDEPMKPDFEDYVPVRYAKSNAEAEFLVTLLNDHGISVYVPEEDDDYELPEDEEGIPVLVPEDNLSEAEDIIEQRAEMDDEFTEKFDEVDDFEDDEEDLEDMDGFGQEEVDDGDDMAFGYDEDEEEGFF